MAAGFNRVILMGNLTRDPELRYTSGNMPVCKFGLAVNRRYKSGDEWKEDATFVDVTIFGARAEPFARHHAKGKPAFIEGELRLDTWEDKNGGGKRSKLYVVANSWEFVGGKSGESAQFSTDRHPEQPSPSPWTNTDPYASSAVDDTPF